MLLALRQNRDVIARLDDLVGKHLDFFSNFVIAASHKPLDRIDGVLRVGNSLPLGDLAHQTFAGFGETDYRGGSAPSFFIGDDLGLSTLHDRHAGVGGPEVNSDNLCHGWLLLNLDKCFVINVEMIALGTMLRPE